MNSSKTKSEQFLTSGKLFLGAPVGINYMWKNIILEKRHSQNWLEKVYHNSPLDDFISVLLSPT